jgi:hypothetical protein
MNIEGRRGKREEKRRKTRLKLGKAYFSSYFSIISPFPLLFKDEL